MKKSARSVLSKKTEAFAKTFCLAFFFFLQLIVKAQNIIFSENFETKVLNSAWQQVTGKWHVADVSELRIAPAENGYRYVLCSGGPGIIRLFVDIPDTVKTRQVKLSFSYYTYAKGPAATVEIEFHKKEGKDGLKGKRQKLALPVKGRWIEFQKILPVPAEGNQMQMIFYEAGSPVKTSKTVCFDTVVISFLR